MLTKLQAINIMLNDSREARINTIDLTDEDTATAIDKLDEATEKIISKGYDFNYDFNRELVPDITGEVILPAFLNIDFEEYKYTKRMDNGSFKVYDKEKNTFKINKKVKANIIYDIDFEEIPSHKIQYYIAKYASFLYYQISIGIDKTLGALQSEMEEAKMEAETQQESNQDYNMFDGNMRVLDRRIRN